MIFPIKLLIYCNNNNYFGGGAGHFGGGGGGGKLLHLKYPKLYGNLSCSFES